MNTGQYIPEECAFYTASKSNPTTSGELVSMHYDCAESLFIAARNASEDAERCKNLLEEVESATRGVAGSNYDVMVRGGGKDAVFRRVARLIEAEHRLEQQMESDYRLIDTATEILYGRDGVSDGLDSIAPRSWADAVYHRYINAYQWQTVASIIGKCTNTCRRYVRAAFELMDANGMYATVAGRGMAEA